MTNQHNKPNHLTGFAAHCAANVGRVRVAKILILGSLLVFPAFILGAQATRPVAGSNQMSECLVAAKDALGDHAEVLKCGEFNSPDALEAVAALRKHAGRSEGSDIFVSRLVILRRVKSRWETALDVARQIRNSEGYVGIEYVDDLSSFWGYAVQFHDRRADGKESFVISLAYMATEKDLDELPVDISWDSTVGRYREFGVNTEPAGFKPELKNPPHPK